MTHEVPSVSRGLTAPARWALQALAALCVVLGLIGVFVPVMPTVPFLLVAAWAASRSSPRLHRWLMSHPRFGKPLRDWNEAGIVSRRAKWFATIAMGMSATAMLFVATRAWIPGALAIIAGMVVVLVWLWRRPEHRAGDGD